jgi:hypothetical protein
MGCDIHSFAEKREGGRWVAIPDLEPFAARTYSVFGWLADVRNYSAVPPISPPRGAPADMSATAAESYDGWGGDAHSASVLTVAELLAVDYEQTVEDRRVTRRTGPNSWNGGATAEPGGGRVETLREFLGQAFFDDLAELQASGAERVVFWFDN